jgi:hypothetical protein
MFVLHDYTVFCSTALFCGHDTITHFGTLLRVMLLLILSALRCTSFEL